jgi:hypothetical protein
MVSFNPFSPLELCKQYFLTIIEPTLPENQIGTQMSTDYISIGITYIWKYVWKYVYMVIAIRNAT